jgi:pimeloyl-ACP methyl ester carboxylesterase
MTARPETPRFRRAFVDGPFGQMHVWMTPPVAGRAPLVLLHPSPYSGAYYHALMQVMAPGRQLIAVDTPGFGASAPPPGPTRLEDYARALAHAVEELNLEESKFDLMGFHTGAMIAVEMAVQQPDRVRRLVLAGLPFQEPAARATVFAPMAKAPILAEDGGHLTPYWNAIAGARSTGASLAAAQCKFADAMAGFTHAWRAYDALSQYPAEIQIPKIRQAVRLLFINEALRAWTLGAVPLFSRAEIIDLPDLNRDAFEIAPGAIAAAINDFLDMGPDHG